MAVPSIFVVTEDAAMLNELCAGAKTLADRVTAVVFGGEADAQAAAACGADAILYAPIGDENSPEDFAAPIAEAVKKDPKAFVFVGNTILGRALAGKLGVLLDTAVFSNVGEFGTVGEALSFTRTVYGGTAVRRLTYTAPYGVVTLNSGAFEAGEPLPACASFAPLCGEVPAAVKRVARNEKHQVTVNLAAAKRIVDVGRGLAAEEDLALCRALAAAIGADVGCSRPVAENNKWMSQYMGITGVQVKPDLIITVGVSGQVQHIGGINKSKVIVAINKDKGAPIFKNCDFGLVGDLYKILPQLTAKLS